MVRPGPTGIFSTGTVRFFFGPAITAWAPAAIERRHAVGGGRGIAQIADHGAAALDLLRADEIGGFDDARPCLLERGMLAHLGAGNRGADLETRCAFFLISRIAVMRLMSTTRSGSMKLALHADEKIGAAREKKRLASCPSPEECMLPSRKSVLHIAFLLPTLSLFLPYRFSAGSPILESLRPGRNDRIPLHHKTTIAWSHAWLNERATKRRAAMPLQDVPLVVPSQVVTEGSTLSAGRLVIVAQARSCSHQARSSRGRDIGARRKAVEPHPDGIRERDA